VKRQKSAFLKLFSFSRHKRRFGAKHASSMIDLNFEDQKNKILVSSKKKKYTHGSKNNLLEHFGELHNEFIGESELCFTIAKIIVLIRRDYKAPKYYKIFEQLWNQESEFLIKYLNTRWLIASTDTFADHSLNSSEIDLSIACSCFANTIKLYESERFLVNAGNNKDDEQKKMALDNEVRFALFDGMSVFKFGTDDTLRNLRWRLDKVAKKNIPGMIFKEIFDRSQNYETIFKRAKDRHKRDRTKWWD